MRDDSKIELKILEAILEKGCTSITAISKTSGISYARVSRRVDLEELKEIQRALDYEKVQKCYRRGMTQREVKNLTHLPDWRVYGLIERAQQELKSAQENIGAIIYHGTLKKALQEDIIFAFAYIHYVKPHVRLSFEEIYRRTRDIISGYSSPKCAERWGVSNAEATRFARAIGFNRQNKKLLKRGKLAVKILIQLTLKIPPFLFKRGDSV